MAITKTVGTSVLALQSIAANSQVISSVQTLTTDQAATIFIQFGRQAKPDGGQVRFRVEASPKSSNDGFWVPIPGGFYVQDLERQSRRASKGRSARAQAL